METYRIDWEGPFAFFKDQELPYLFDQEPSRHSGLYMWAVPTSEGLKVNYVGKAGGMDTGADLKTRVWQGLTAGLSGQYIQVVDMDSWRRGFRQVLHDFDSFDVDDHRDALEEMHRLCVGFLARIDADRATIERCERAVIQRLRRAYDDGPAYDPYFSNKAPGNNPASVEYRVQSFGRDIRGLPYGCVLNQDGALVAAIDGRT